MDYAGFIEDEKTFPMIPLSVLPRYEGLTNYLFYLYFYRNGLHNFGWLDSGNYEDSFQCFCKFSKFKSLKVF